MATYYIDFDLGLSQNDGLSESAPAGSLSDIKIVPGDTVLFKRGTLYRGALDAVSGEKGKCVNYGAYGEGENPTFSGSVDISSPDLWKEEEKNIWRYVGEEKDEPCNIIFDNGKSCGTLRWTYGELKSQGDWVDGDMGKSEFKKYKRKTWREWDEKEYPEGYTRPLYIYSEGNPGEVYSHIECALYGKFALAWANYATFRDINFINSGVHAIK